MHFTDTFIRRPVLAIVISLFILVLGLRSMGLLKVREFPFTRMPCDVTTVYTGSDPSVVSGFITTPWKIPSPRPTVSTILTSSSTPNQSVIQANLLLNYDPNKALTESIRGSTPR